MATDFPGSLDALTNPTATSPRNNPSHSAQHSNANDAIEALQAKVGVDGSAVTSSLDYRVGATEGEIDLLSYSSSATGANTARLMQRLKRGTSDAEVLVIGDSTGNETDEWVYLSMVELAARFPAYTVLFYFWDETAENAYESAVTLQTGTGAYTLSVYNCSKAGSSSGYVLGSRWSTAISSRNPDLIFVSHGHNQGGPPSAAMEYFYRNQYLSLTEELTQTFPEAGLVLVAQNPSLVSGREEWQAQRADILAGVAALRGYGFIDVHQAFVDTGDVAALMADTSHPNSAGSQLWASVVGEALTSGASSVSSSSPSSLTRFGRNYLSNPEFSAWSGTNPDDWTPTLSATSKDTTNFETGTYGAKITSTSGSGSAYIEQVINLATSGVLHLRGQVVTVAMRVYVPASNTATARIYIQDSTGGANLRLGDVFSSTRDRFCWVFATKRIDAAATSITVRAMCRTTGTAVVEATVDRVYLVQGILPVGAVEEEVTVASDGTWAPQDQGLVAWNFDPGLASGNAAFAANTYYVFAVKLPTGTATNIVTYVTQVATTTRAFGALYDPNGNLLAQTANEATSLQSLGEKEWALSSPQDVTEGVHYVVLWVSSTTPRFASTNGVTPSANALMSDPYRAGSMGSSGTSETAPASLSAVTASTVALYWVGVS